MISVAFCDDIGSLNKMQGFLDRYCRERGWEIAHTVFHSPLELLAEIKDAFWAYAFRNGQVNL